MKRIVAIAMIALLAGGIAQAQDTPTPTPTQTPEAAGSIVAPIAIPSAAQPLTVLTIGCFDNGPAGATPTPTPTPPATPTAPAYPIPCPSDGTGALRVPVGDVVVFYLRPNSALPSSMTFLINGQDTTLPTTTPITLLASPSGLWDIRLDTAGYTSNEITVKAQ